MQKPSIPKGTRDFLPQETTNRNYIFDTIKSIFHKYGFNQIETPAVENLATLMGKYGEEGDKLLFKILNSGDYLTKVPKEMLDEKNSTKIITQISEKGLRYDLTVPFARFVVQHRNEISFPFKRFQIQPVWRADRPQKGRYREFYQCDIDVIGSPSLINEVELLQIVDEVYQDLQINVLIKLNNRKILSGIAETIGYSDKIVDLTVAIDKMEKIGEEKINEELREKGFSDKAIKTLRPILDIKGNNHETLETLRIFLQKSEVGMKGIEEITEVLGLVDMVGIKTPIKLDLTLARGLNYYTGAIFEVKAIDVEIGSITGGGRYDNLTGIFGLKDVSGVGISFGADRIYDVLQQLDLFPTTTNNTTQLLFVHFDEATRNYALRWATELREKGLNIEVYPDCVKMKKQMIYANNNNIPYVAIVGENEKQENVVMLKNMETGEQTQKKQEELFAILQNA